jgi:transcriptional regulator
MYRPPAFREDRIEVMHALMRAHPLATLVTGGEHGLMASAIPCLIEADGSEFGVLRAHLARPNDQLDALRGGAEVLAIFQGPQAYVTPSWYASKAKDGKVVPTWNYATVHAWGMPRVIEDAAWLRAQVARLTAAQERGRAEPWAVEDAPESFIASQLRGIVGVEIPIRRLEGKWKVSQNRSAADRKGVVAGFAEEGQAAMAWLVADAGPDSVG